MKLNGNQPLWASFTPSETQNPGRYRPVFFVVDHIVISRIMRRIHALSPHPEGERSGARRAREKQLFVYDQPAATGRSSAFLPLCDPGVELLFQIGERQRAFFQYRVVEVCQIEILAKAFLAFAAQPAQHDFAGLVGKCLARP